jgi:hypothetical protein
MKGASMELSHQRTKIIIGLAVLGLVTALTAVLLLRADNGTAGSTNEVNASFAVLEPASESAKAGLSDQSKTWLAETDRGGLAGVAEEPLVAVGSTQTAVGSVVIAQFGQYLCAYSDELGMSNCGSMALINEGKLLTYQPSCPTTTVFGILPDGFEEVEATAAGKDSRSIPVVGNVYSAEIPTADTVLSAKGAKGDSFELALPLGAENRGCKA